MPTGQDLIDYWISKLPEGEKKIFKILIDFYPDSVNREALSDVTSYMPSSRNTYLQRMKAKEIISIESGLIKASENLFL